MPRSPIASIVIPTHSRPGYLETTLASVVPQALEHGAEVIVAQDGPNAEVEAVAGRHEVRRVQSERQMSANAARNAGIRAAEGELIVLIDDDVEVPPGWLEQLLAGVRRAPGHEVFGGPIRARLEGGGPRSCGGEPPPITTLDLGPADREAVTVWGANMAIRRSAIERVGPFDEGMVGHGDEEEWLHRYRVGGGRILYLAGAGLDHRRTAEDSRLLSLARAAYGQGRATRRLAVRLGTSRSIVHEAWTLAGCCSHLVRRRCLYGLVMAARTAGTIREIAGELAGRRQPAAASAGGTDDFLSGTSGQVYGFRATSRALMADGAADARAFLAARQWRLARAAQAGAQRRVLVLAVWREGMPNLLDAAVSELTASRHEVTFLSTPVGDRGKFENVNRLLADHPAAGYDWLIVLDDDVSLPRGFLDRFLFLAERFDLSIVQPAHRHRSHAAWTVTRRRARSVARETAFVEVGPVVAFRADSFELVMPFPDLRFGWGLDAHWSALARQRGRRIGIIDATPVRHGLRRIASSYDRRAAIDEGREFLVGRPYTTRDEAGRTVTSHRRWG